VSHESTRNMPDKRLFTQRIILTVACNRPWQSVFICIYWSGFTVGRTRKAHLLIDTVAAIILLQLLLPYSVPHGDYTILRKFMMHWSVIHQVSHCHSIRNYCTRFVNIFLKKKDNRGIEYVLVRTDTKYISLWTYTKLLFSNYNVPMKEPG
jgi:hypothetical protein